MATTLDKSTTRPHSPKARRTLTMATTSVTVSFPKNKATNLYDWQQHEATQAYREDQDRFPTSTQQPVCRYAHFHGEHGWAIRDCTDAVYFLPDAGGRVLLHNVDIPALILGGRVDLAQQQRVLDDRRGTLARIATTRRQEVQ
jgi:hypothetical protein